VYGRHGAVGSNLFLASYFFAAVPPLMRILAASPPHTKIAAVAAASVTVIVTVVSIRVHGGGGVGEGLGGFISILSWAGYFLAPYVAGRLGIAASEINMEKIVGASAPPVLTALTLFILRRRDWSNIKNS